MAHNIVRKTGIASYNYIIMRMYIILLLIPIWPYSIIYIYNNIMWALGSV